MESSRRSHSGTRAARRLTLDEIRRRCVCIDMAHAYPDVERVLLVCRPGEPWAREEALLREQGFRVAASGPGELAGENVTLFERRTRKWRR